MASRKLQRYELLLIFFCHCSMSESVGFIEFCRCCVNKFLFSYYLLKHLLDTFSCVYICICFLFFFVILRTIAVVSMRSSIYRYLAGDFHFWVDYGQLSKHQLSIDSTIYRFASVVQYLYARALSFDTFLTGVTQTNILLTFRLFTPFTSICMHVQCVFIQKNCRLYCWAKAMNKRTNERIASLIMGTVLLKPKHCSSVPLLLLWRRMKHSLGLNKCCTYVHI